MCELPIECNAVIKPSYSLKGSWFREHMLACTNAVIRKKITLIGRENKEASGKLVMFCFLFWLLVKNVYKNE